MDRGQDGDTDGFASLFSAFTRMILVLASSEEHNLRIIPT